MNLNMDLGQKGHPYPAEVKSPSEDSVRYPCFYYEGTEPLGLAKEGEMMIQFRITSESMSENDKGEKRYSCTVEVKKILDAEGEEETAPKANVSDLLDGLMRAHMAKNSKDAEESY